MDQTGQVRDIGGHKELFIDEAPIAAMKNVRLTMNAPNHEWSQRQSLVMVAAKRQLPDRTSLETRYVISSLPPDAKLLLAATPAHWSIENSVHWALNVAFRAHDSRIRQGNAQHNMAILRRLAPDLLRNEKGAAVGVAAKPKRAGSKTDYLHNALSQKDANALCPGSLQEPEQSYRLYP